ncbi:MAG: phytanoyl-CoA dioxygenase family protein [Planctomycetota bacterium]|nr:phytanoyl-CoA dioxygenase family protein [Planctomycetota bacterium]
MKINKEHLLKWQRDGYLCLPGLLTHAEADNAKRWVDEISSWPEDSNRWMHHREETAGGEVRLSRTENFVPFHDGMRDLLTRGKLLDAIGQLMGEAAVLYKEKINYKYPGGAGYAAHQDAPAYEFIQHHVTCLVAIDPMTESNGCLQFAAGRHNEGLIGLTDAGCIEKSAADALDWVAVETFPGDVLFFSSYAPHKSGANTSEIPRRAIYLTYNAAAEGDFREEYYRDKRETFARHKQAGSPEMARISKIGHFQGKTVHE